MFERIIVGTDGSDTAAEAVRQATELARATGAKLDIVSAYQPVSQGRLREESGEIPGDVAYAVGPKEDVNVILEACGGPGEGGRRRGQHARARGRPGRRDPRRRRAGRRERDRGRQQGHDRRPPLPARQRAEQDLPSRPLQRLHRADDVARLFRGRPVADAPGVDRPRGVEQAEPVEALGVARARRALQPLGHPRRARVGHRRRRWRSPARRRRWRAPPTSRCRRRDGSRTSHGRRAQSSGKQA